MPKPEEVHMEKAVVLKKLPRTISRLRLRRLRVLKPGDPPQFLFTSVSNTRFDLIHLSSSHTYAEYYHHIPGSLWGYDFSEQLMVMKEAGKWVGYYDGVSFCAEDFCIQGGNKKNGDL
jgi:hypothetical protein